MNRDCRALLVDSDGRLLVGGNFTEAQGERRSALARFDQKGQLDPHFRPEIGGEVHQMLLDAEGRILLIGSGLESVNGRSRKGIARLLPDGRLDENFFPKVSEWLNCAALQPDGKILIGGSFDQVNGTERHFLARLLPEDGALDPTFVPPNIERGFETRIMSIVIQADGDVIIGGRIHRIVGQSWDNIARLDRNGHLNPSFRFSWPGNEIRTLTPQADGRILLTSREPAKTAYRPVLGRVTNDVAQDALQLEAGQVVWQRGGSAPLLRDVALETSWDEGETWVPLGAGERSREAAGMVWIWKDVSHHGGLLRASGRYLNGAGLLQQLIEVTAQGEASLPSASLMAVEKHLEGDGVQLRYSLPRGAFEELTIEWSPSLLPNSWKPIPGGPVLVSEDHVSLHYEVLELPKDARRKGFFRFRRP